MNPSTHWTFCHANDIHLGTPRSYRYDPSRNHNWAVLHRQMEAFHPDLLLVGGDLTRPSKAAYEELVGAAGFRKVAVEVVQHLPLQPLRSRSLGRASCHGWQDRSDGPADNPTPRRRHGRPHEDPRHHPHRPRR